jgi:[glutamine synthetase] adenylyltransferase / [glutamine synthetase]-adenylyl-L-tyrosine phosphorylase
MRGWIRSGLPKSTLRGMRATMNHAYHTGETASYVTVRSGPGGRNPHVTDVFPGRSANRYTLNLVSGTRTSLSGWLARMGFADVPRAERELAALGIAGGDHPLLAALAQAPDPDLALAGLAQVAERDQNLLGELAKDPAFRARLVAVLGVSRALADHLARHPADSAVLRGRDADRRPEPSQLRADLLRAVGADPDDWEPVAAAGDGKTDPAALLAAAYRRGLLHLAARDQTGVATIDEAAAELADLADAVLESALAVARSEHRAEGTRLAIVAMGKCGARELNYASDVDVIFVAEPADSGTAEEAALSAATRLAAGTIQVCERTTPEGAIFPVDPNLRPEGRQGPLVRTLASHLAYYDRWAKTWEFQALLKARPAAGDRDLGRRYATAVAPLVWQASQRDNFVEDVQAMRRRVVATLPRNMAGRELKLGPGGLRDIEFAVQLLQLVHGSADDRLRVPATLPALRALADGGYVGRADAEDLAQAYRFLRQTEHLLQIYQLRRTHTLPTDPAVLRRLGRALRKSHSLKPIVPNGPLVPPAPVAPSLGRAQPGPRGLPVGGRPAPPPGGPALSGGSALPPSGSARPLPGSATQAPEEAFTQAWTRHAQQVRRLHEKLFYRPLLDAVAKLPSGAARLTPDAARARLEALGYRDPAGALRHIEALTSGLRRRAAIQRTLLPVLLGWFADAAEPDAGLLAFRQVSEALGETPWFLRLLRDETKAAERIACVLASSRYATGLLLRAPEAVAIFADDAELVPKTADALRAEMMAAARRHAADLIGPSAADAEQAAVTIRSLRRRELLRVAAADVLGLIGLAETAEALTAITTATLDAVLAVATAKIEMELRAPLPIRFAVIAMGRYGGHESGFGSDADVIFVYDPLPSALAAPDGERQTSEAAQSVGAELRRLLSLPAPDPPLLVDADLRPEGRQGPLVRSLAACAAYYERRAAPWEFQALLRAEFAVGSAELGAEFIALADRFRYPDSGPGDPAVREIRRIKARMEAERIPRGTDRALHLKLGPGGLSDVEWTVQLLQLRYGYEVDGLRTTRTLAALDAAVAADLVTAADAAALSASWRFGSRVRNAIMLVRGRPGDAFPAKHDELTAVARLLGYKPSSGGSAGGAGGAGGYAAADAAGRAGNSAAGWDDTPAQALEEDYRRTARRARTVMDRVFYG